LIWLPDRSRHQRRIVAALYELAADVPCGRRAVFAGGPRGADKLGVLAQTGIDASGYFPVSIDLVLAETARRSMIPVVARLSPLDGADLVNGEAQHVAKRLTARAIADGRDVLLDVTMGQPAICAVLAGEPGPGGLGRPGDRSAHKLLPTPPRPRRCSSRSATPISSRRAST
jgi:hypothetical protein